MDVGPLSVALPFVVYADETFVLHKILHNCAMLTII